MFATIPALSDAHLARLRSFEQPLGYAPLAQVAAFLRGQARLAFVPTWPSGSNGPRAERVTTENDKDLWQFAEINVSATRNSVCYRWHLSIRWRSLSVGQ